MSILNKMKRKRSRLLLGLLVTAGGILSPQNVFAEEESDTYVRMPYEFETNEEQLNPPSSNDKEMLNNEVENPESASTSTTEGDKTPKDGAGNESESEGKAQNSTETGENAALDTEQIDEEASGDIAMIKYLNQFAGKTIVDVEYEGASELTLPTVKLVATQHAGDEFTSASSMSDMEKLMNTGYFYDIYPVIEEVPEGVVVKYHLLENPILKDIVFVGNTIEKTEDLERLIHLRRDDVLNNVTLHDDITAIQERYRGTGYVLMKVTDINMDKDTGVLTLKINEGIIEGYKVKGNKKTKDKVILREMRQKPGEIFNAKLARRSIQRLNNLGFFEEVSAKMNPGVEPNAIVMEIEVKEKRTGTFGVGAGYSSEDGIIGMVSITDTNFRGVGDAVSITYEMSGDDEDAHGVTFSYRRPWLDSKETSGTFRFYNRTYEYDDYDTRGRLKEEYMRKYTGGEITLGRPVSEWSTNYVTLRHRKDEYVKHVGDGLSGRRDGELGSAWRSKNFGITRSVTLEHVTDTRDNIYNPTEGGKVNLSGEFGGVLGGDFTFQKYTIDHQRFFKAGHAQVWALRTKGGIGFGDISEFNQYRIGGQDTLRGYRDAQFRGERMILGTLEYRFPLFPKVQGALFTDWGSAWDDGFDPDEFHGSGGLGVSLNTPLGPLRLDYGRGSQGGRLHFSVGGTF